MLHNTIWQEVWPIILTCNRKNHIKLCSPYKETLPHTARIETAVPCGAVLLCVFAMLPRGRTPCHTAVPGTDIAPWHPNAQARVDVGHTAVWRSLCTVSSCELQRQGYIRENSVLDKLTARWDDMRWDGTRRDGGHRPVWLSMGWKKKEWKWVLAANKLGKVFKHFSPMAEKKSVQCGTRRKATKEEGN